jgi:DNA-binding response OmpR family regulator
MVDGNTLLVPAHDYAALMAAFQAIQIGATKPTMLIVEDEALAAAAAREALEKAYRVEVAYDGGTALRVWREAMHELVLLDLMLPDISGVELLTTMMIERPSQVVIVLTAYDAPEQHQELVLAGAMAGCRAGD